MYFPFIAAVFAQILAVRIQYLVLQLSSCFLQQAFSLFDVFMAEIAFKLELLKVEDACYEGVHIENVDDYEQNQQNRKDVVESLAKNRHYICFTHHFRESCCFVVDDLEEVIA